MTIPKMISLFERYPSLKEKIPYISLGEFPTPIEKLDRLGEALGLNSLYIKRDDLSGKIYGGNKIRKLEFLMADAIEKNVKEVLTFGYAGSNHATATAVYAQKLGLRSISMLLPQPNAHYLRRNLLMSHYCNAELHQHQNMPLLVFATFYQLLRHRLRYGHFPHVIWAGGTSTLGNIGFVNAAFELRDQIEDGEMPEPDLIYVPSGTMGTSAGLILGLKAANLESRVVCVRVADEKFANTKRTLKLLRATNSLLSSLEPFFPLIEFSKEDVNIRHDFFGQHYALFTEKGMEAVKRMKATEGIGLDGTYTGKALAALIDDAEKNDLKDKVVLFWNTYNSKDFSHMIASIDYRQLPRPFHKYFEEEVQKLDKI
ncbi:MAG: pyridoxal-phosphate dependent enzyme [Candidatus Bathyarchaeota archaeon]|nr:pyridoxal-phosphate dependent enzyme [Candidatus Bathyarchaeota archaeon]